MLALGARTDSSHPWASLSSPRVNPVTEAAQGLFFTLILQMGKLRGGLTFPKSHSQEAAEMGFQPRSLTSHSLWAAMSCFLSLSVPLSQHFQRCWWACEAGALLQVHRGEDSHPVTIRIVAKKSNKWFLGSHLLSCPGAPLTGSHSQDTREGHPTSEARKPGERGKLWA